MKRYGFVIDTGLCMGCNSCSVACKIENNIPSGIYWNRLLTEGGDGLDSPSGKYPEKGESSTLKLRYLTLACQHCSNPACVKVCPVGATYKDLDTGVVRQDYDRCIGCRMCMAACPYTGVRSFNWEEPAYTIDFAIGSPDVPAHQKHTVEKCTMCWQRIAKGTEPFCIKACPGRARFWGDLDDPASEVCKAIAGREYKTLLPEKGTKPSVYYLL